MLKICSDFFKTGLKIYYFCQHSKKAKKWPNGQTILFLANSFKNGQMATLCIINGPLRDAFNSFAGSCARQHEKLHY